MWERWRGGTRLLIIVVEKARLRFELHMKFVSYVFNEFLDHRKVSWKMVVDSNAMPNTAVLYATAQLDTNCAVGSNLF